MNLCFNQNFVFVAARSCKDMKEKLSAAGVIPLDGIYSITTLTNPVYCDMSRDGGGWTLVVSSHSNSWTAENVKDRNGASPSLTFDYSILKDADSLKNTYLTNDVVQYRLEAQNFGMSQYFAVSPLQLLHLVL